MVDEALREGQREVSRRGKRATGQTRGCVCHAADREDRDFLSVAGKDDILTRATTTGTKRGTQPTQVC